MFRAHLPASVRIQRGPPACSRLRLAMGCGRSSLDEMDESPRALRGSGELRRVLVYNGPNRDSYLVGLLSAGLVLLAE